MTPVFFFSHGSPMNAIENNIFTQDWQALYRGTITPSAIVVFSAHWHVPGIRITTAKKLKTLHDFGGFPEALMQQQYPAATAIDTANKISAILKDQGHTIIHDENWGLDHGSWAVLKQLHPNADIPVIQISLDRSQSSLQWHYELAAALKPLRNEGVLFIGSGGIVHNIHKWMTSSPQDDFSWAKDFDNTIATAIKKRDIDTLFNCHKLPYAIDAVPTIEHYLPLIYCMALTDETDRIEFSDFFNQPYRDLAICSSRSIKFSSV